VPYSQLEELLPDGGLWVGSCFTKRHILDHDPAYLRRFALETRRSELAHWSMALCFPLFYFWNPPWAKAVMTFYALGVNLPCILTQRYNRARVEGILEEISPRRKRLIERRVGNDRFPTLGCEMNANR
jgi:glycosyl-4,4'-diaponeurosporenoate acyltransferase